MGGHALAAVGRVEADPLPRTVFDRLRLLDSRPAAILTFASVTTMACVLVFVWGSGLWFSADEWDFRKLHSEWLAESLAVNGEMIGFEDFRTHAARVVAGMELAPLQTPLL